MATMTVKNLWVVSLNCVLLLACVAPAFAQRIEAEAFLGKPFGVGRITLDLPPELLPQPLGIDGLVLTESSNRVFYPALESAGAMTMALTFCAIICSTSSTCLLTSSSSLIPLATRS